MKNLYLVLLVGAITFAAISIASEFRPDQHGDYGRLYTARKLPTPLPAEKPVVITEQDVPPVPDHAVADPTLVRTMTGEEYLGVVRPAPTFETGTEISTEASLDSSSFAAPPAPVVNAVRKGERLVLTGGPEGVRLDVRKTQ